MLSVIVFITSFSTTLQGWAYVAAFGLLYFAYSVVFTMNDIAYWGMVPALARRADDRNRLTSVSYTHLLAVVFFSAISLSSQSSLIWFERFVL